MNNKDKFTLYNNTNEFEYNKSKSDINISFNRVAFIFLFFYNNNYLFNSFNSSWFQTI